MLPGAAADPWISGVHSPVASPTKNPVHKAFPPNSCAQKTLLLINQLDFLSRFSIVNRKCLDCLSHLRSIGFGLTKVLRFLSCGVLTKSQQAHCHKPKTNIPQPVQTHRLAKMRSIIFTTFLLPSISALQIPSILSSFYEPQGLTNDTSSLESDSQIPHELLKRDGNCPVNYNSCSTLAANYGGACCIAGSSCTTDHAKNIACCPTGALCTGTLTAGTAATTTGGVVTGGTTTSGATATTTTSNNGATITSAAATGVVANQYFPFPIIATTYVNSAACAQAYTACQGNYAACTADLQGSQFGVTVVAPAGGVTVAPTVQNLGTAAATSICSSLSLAACRNLQSTDCAQFGVGTATSGGSFNVGSTNAAGARQTMGCVARIGVVAGVGLGVIGQMV